MKQRRRIGATLGLVACVVLVLVVIGIASFFFIKILGGGRELANATDSGALNIAKQAIKNPHRSAASFGSDVVNNFGLLSDGGEFDLLSYNRVVAHAYLVAVNAKAEGTGLAANNAKKLYSGMTGIGKFLKQSLESEGTMGGYFTDLTARNNTRMLGNNGIAISEYAVGYVRPSGSTNVKFTIAPGSGAPTSSSGFMAGYKPFSVDVGGDNMVFCGVPLYPKDQPHLISNSEFNARSSGGGADYVPANAFRAGGDSKDNHTRRLINAVACSIVGCMNNTYDARFQYGYLEIVNGPSMPTPAPRANTQDDIFSHELSDDGLYAQGKGATNVFTTDPHAYWGWYNYNSRPADWIDPNNPTAAPRQDPNSPRPSSGPADFRRVDGNAVTLADLESIKNRPTHCVWTMYTEPEPQPLCVDLLDSFKQGYNRPGTVDTGHVAPTGFTALESFKSDVLAQRETARTCVDISAPAGPSGVKWFSHGRSGYSEVVAPSSSNYNFELVRSPYDYLTMIDQVSNNCGSQSVLVNLLERCKQISPGCSMSDVVALLSATPLPLGGRQYIYDGGSGLQISTSPPPWVVAGTEPDGNRISCGKAYDVMSNIVNSAPLYNTSEGDGDFPYVPFGQAPGGSCQDQAEWTPSSGFNQLLGRLEFSNKCFGGGTFCQPN